MKKEIVIEGIKGVWTPIEEVTAVPPGILQMSNRFGLYTFDLIHMSYEANYARAIELRYRIVHSIKVEGTLWECDEITDRGKIERFTYNPSGWYARIDGYDYFLKHVRKIPQRTPICSLPDENGRMVEKFIGDHVYCVSGELIHDFTLQDAAYNKTWPDYFASYAAAEAHLAKTRKEYVYIVNNKFEIVKAEVWKQAPCEGVALPTLELAKAYVLEHRPVVPYGELQEAYINFPGTSGIVGILKKYKPSETI